MWVMVEPCLPSILIEVAADDRRADGMRHLHFGGFADWLRRNPYGQCRLYAGKIPASTEISGIIGASYDNALLPMNLLNSTTPSTALVRAIRRTLRPLVRLMLASGVTYPLVSELLKGVFVEVADREFRLGGQGADRQPHQPHIGGAPQGRTAAARRGSGHR